MKIDIDHVFHIYYDGRGNGQNEFTLRIKFTKRSYAAKVARDFGKSGSDI